MDCRRFALAALVLAAGAAPATAEIRARQDGKGTVYEVDGIAADPSGCHPFTLMGKVVGRKFAANGVTLDTITYERKDGTRDIVNVDPPPDSIGMADLGPITTGLQQLSKVGRTMRGRAFACGASGRVSFLDEIR